MRADDELPASPMAEVRRALAQLDQQGLDLWARSATSRLLVDRAAKIYIVADGQLVDTSGQQVLGEFLDLLAPYIDGGHLRGPDLRRPRPHLRIAPGKCAGEPHLSGSRLTTPTIAALATRGYDVGMIVHLYPDADPVAIEEALDLERHLSSTIAA